MIARDITRRLEGQKQLALDRELLDSTLRSMSDGVLVTDRECNVSLMNAAAERLTGTSAADVRGLPLAEVLPFSLPGPVRNTLISWADGLAHEIVIDGSSTVYYEVVTTSISDWPAEHGWVLALRDVTLEREEQQRREQEGRLAAMGQLAAGLAHDFRNLMTTILTSAELLAESPRLDAADSRIVNVIGGAGAQGASIARRVLDFSRRSSPRKVPVDLKVLMADVVELLHHALPKPISIVTEVPAGDFLVDADATQVQQVLTNLAINGADAMPTGGTLTFLLSKRVPDDRDTPSAEGVRSWITLDVIDTGGGMSPHVAEHAFDPYFTTKGPGRGTGLGLAQAHGIVTDHGGLLAISSELGKGTQVSMHLVASQAPATPIAPESKPTAASASAAVLLVEDDDDLRDVLSMWLEQQGCRVLTARSAEEATEIFDTFGDTLDVVLTDLGMPVQDGLAL